MTIHPTFGRVPRVVTIKHLKAGTELSCHYMIDMEEAAADPEQCKWYVDLWDEFSRGMHRQNNANNDNYDMDTADDDTVSMNSV